MCDRRVAALFSPVGPLSLDLTDLLSPIIVMNPFEVKLTMFSGRTEATFEYTVFLWRPPQ